MSLNLGDLPDDILIHLFRAASPRDVARAKRVNKRFLNLVEHHNIGKPRVRELSIESRNQPPSSPPKIGRFRINIGNTSATNRKRRLVVTMKREKTCKQVETTIDDASCSTSFVQENLRKIVVEDRLSFEGIDIDEQFYEMLTARGNDLSNVHTVSFVFCRLTIKWEQFVDMFSKMRLQNLYIDFCTFDSSLISDKVLTTLEHLQTLKIQPRCREFFHELTDATPSYWSRRDRPMIAVQLYNCGSRITLDGVRSMMMCPSMSTIPSTTCLDWDFGIVIEPTHSDSVLASLFFDPGLRLSVVDDFRSRRVKMFKQHRHQIAFNLFQPTTTIQPSPSPSTTAQLSSD